ncbi:hypothetical protein H0H92_015116 [Tricholoma furcatifolium]|nr:hypothetical protein H0H92_015116 [Tricholoma furcatifolium]
MSSQSMEYFASNIGFASFLLGCKMEMSICILSAVDVAKGLLYLHENGIIHGDLKGVSWEFENVPIFTDRTPQSNILIDSTGRARLADFGISAVSDSDIIAWSSQSSGASKGGSARWQAPELFDIEDGEEVKNSVASDVYAWGCVAFELFTGTVPYAGIQRETAIALHIKSGGRPTRPRASSKSWEVWGLTEEIWSIMEQSWEGQSTQRPSSAQIVERLEMMISPDTRAILDTCILAPGVFRRQMDVPFEIVTVEAFDLILNNGLNVKDKEWGDPVHGVSQAQDQVEREIPGLTWTQEHPSLPARTRRMPRGITGASAPFSVHTWIAKPRSLIRPASARNSDQRSRPNFAGIGNQRRHIIDISDSEDEGDQVVDMSVAV